VRKFLQSRGRKIRLTVIWILPWLAGAFLSAIDGKRDWLGGFAAYSSLLLFSTLLIELSIQRMQVDRPIAWLGRGVFWLRLMVGVGLMGLLPALGYQDSVVSQAGYVFQDAYIRDKQAWGLASSPQPIASAFTGTYSGDQYGGMLSLSAATYRLLSPGFHRPILVLIWVSLAGGLSAVILWRVVRDWLANSHLDATHVASTAALVYAFYPEAVLLGSSHMREAVVMLGITILMRGYILLSRSDIRWLYWFLTGSLILMAFQVPLAVATLFVLFGLYFLEPGRKLDWRIVIFFLFLMALALAGSFLVFAALPSLSDASPIEIFQTWLARNFTFQTHLAERSSGMLQKLFASAGERFIIPIVIGYGAAQPVLPATLVDPAAPVWRVINVLRAAGWYLLAPLLVFASITVVYPQFTERRWQRLWLSLACLTWVLIAAANAGGDQWDNPRYRTLFLPWMATLVAWVWSWARHNRNPWGYRFLVISGLFSLSFLQWYISRYFPALIHFDIRLMIIFSGVIIVTYLVCCLIWDVRSRKEGDV
jgi:hypothetical protein